jgi:hypothetical protein
MNGKGTLILSLVSLGVGTALMYWFDPDTGRRRRSQTRNQTRRAIRQAQKLADNASRSLDRVSRMSWQEVGKAVVPLTAKALLGR